MEDKVTQSMFSFVEQDAPVSLGVIFDVSGSVKNTLAEAKAALRSFFEISNPEDEAFLHTVSTHPQKQAGFTRDYGNLLGAIVNTSLIWGSQGRRTLFGRYGITGLVNVDITPEFCAKLGRIISITLTSRFDFDKPCFTQPCQMR